MPNMPLKITPGDCHCALLYGERHDNPEQRPTPLIGMSHLNRATLVNDIVALTMHHLIDTLKCNPESIRFAIFPGLQLQFHTVNPAYLDAASQRFWLESAFCKQDPNSSLVHLDVLGMNIHLLSKHIPTHNISAYRLDSWSNADNATFSHRRASHDARIPRGRNMLAIQLQATADD